MKYYEKYEERKKRVCKEVEDLKKQYYKQLNIDISKADTKEETINNFYRRKFLSLWDLDGCTNLNKTMYDIYNDICHGSVIEYAENTALPLHTLIEQVAKVNEVDYLKLFKKLEKNRDNVWRDK